MLSIRGQTKVKIRSIQKRAQKKRKYKFDILPIVKNNCIYFIFQTFIQ